MPTKYAGFEPIAQPTLVATFGKWITKITRPSDGDYITAASVYVALDGLTDRTNWLAWRTIDIRGGGTYLNAPVIMQGFWRFEDELEASDLQLTDGSWPTLFPARSWERHSLRLLTCTRGTPGSGPDDPLANLPDAWINAVGGAPTIQTRSTNSSAQFHWIALDDLPDGGTISTVSVTLKGADAGTDPMTFPKYRVARFKGTGALEYLCAEANDEHVFADWETAKTKTLTVTANATIDKSYTYVVIVKHAYAGTAAGTAYVLDVKSVGTADRLGL